MMHRVFFLLLAQGKKSRIRHHHCFSVALVNSISNKTYFPLAFPIFVFQLCSIPFYCNLFQKISQLPLSSFTTIPIPSWFFPKEYKSDSVYVHGSFYFITDSLEVRHINNCFVCLLVNTIRPIQTVIPHWIGFYIELNSTLNICVFLKKNLNISSVHGTLLDHECVRINEICSN